MEVSKVLDLPMPANDADAKTIRDYLRALLSHLWAEEDRFSGKRPFGNSGWKHEVWAALIEGGAIGGSLDSDGYVNEIDSDAADKIIQGVITALCASQ